MKPIYTADGAEIKLHFLGDTEKAAEAYGRNKLEAELRAALDGQTDGTAVHAIFETDGRVGFISDEQFQAIMATPDLETLRHSLVGGAIEFAASLTKSCQICSDMGCRNRRAEFDETEFRLTILGLMVNIVGENGFSGCNPGKK